MNENELKTYFNFLAKMRGDGKDMLTGGMMLMNEYGLDIATSRDVVQQWWSAQGPGQDNAVRALKPVTPLPIPSGSPNEPLPAPESKPVSISEKLAKRFGIGTA